MKTRLILLLLLVFVACKGFSQEKLNKVSVNPIQLFGLNIANFEYERGFNEGKLGVSFFYGRTGNVTREIGGNTMYVTEQNVNVKRYTKNISMNSFWYGGQLSVASAIIYSSKSIGYGATNVGTLGLSGKIGYQFILKSFYLNFYGGLGYALTNDLFGKANYYGNIGESKLLLTFGINAGIAF